MKTNGSHAWPATAPETTISVYNSQTRRNRPGVVKQLLLPAPPDETTIRRLNELAKKGPFCAPLKAKKHELL